MPSGENAMVEQHGTWLKEAGIPFIPLQRFSDELLSAGVLAQLRTAWHLPGSRARRHTLAAELATYADRRTVLHLHNPWPLWTYDVALAAQAVGIPVVQTLHNYRLIATNDRWVVEGRVRRPRNGPERQHVAALGAMHQSRVAEWAYRRSLARMWAQRIPQRSLDAVVCLTRFQRQQVIAAGFSPERIHVISNALPNPGPPEAGRRPGDHAIFVGRLDAMKGIDWLMKAWPATGLPLLVVGDGPLAGCCSGIDGVQWLGRQPRLRVSELLRQARFLVMASRWYEGQPLVILEALAAGVPCLVPDLGGMPEVIGAAGRTYRPGEASDLAAQAQALWQHPPEPAIVRAAYDQTGDSVARHLQLYESLLAGAGPRSS